jgi:hypothetical protein
MYESLSSEVGVWAVGGEAWGVQALGHTVRQRELDGAVVELLDLSTTRLAGWHHLHLDDLDGGGTGTVTGAHVTVCNG